MDPELPAHRVKAPPYYVKIDPNDALHLVQQGASLLLLDVPQTTLFGFDRQMFAVGPHFKGMKMIPPGPHFVYYSATSRHGNESSPVTGFFIHPGPGEVIVRKWDVKEERLIKLMDSNEEEHYQLAVKNLEFDRHLGTYDVHHYQAWKQLTSYLTKSSIERFEPVGADISVIAEAEFAEKQTQTPAEMRLLEHLKKNRGVNAHKFHLSVAGDVDDNASTQEGRKNTSGRCFYTSLPHLVKQSGVTGTELTALNVDKSAVLETLLNKQYGGSEDLLLAELQFSFIAFLMGQSLESFSQWKSIVCLMLNCEDAPLHRRTHLFIKFLEVVCFQLKTSLKSSNPTTIDSEKAESLFLDDYWFSKDNFLRLLFKEFYCLVRDAQPVDGDLLRQARRLKGLLESSLGWILDVEGDTNDDDEYAPMVVMEEELTDQG